METTDKSLELKNDQTAVGGRPAPACSRSSVNDLYLACKPLTKDYGIVDHRDMLLSIVERCHKILTAESDAVIQRLYDAIGARMMADEPTDEERIENHAAWRDAGKFLSENAEQSRDDGENLTP